MVFIASCGQPALKIQSFFMSLSEIVEKVCPDGQNKE